MASPCSRRVGSSSCGAQAQLLLGMWGLLDPGIKPVSPALAGGFLSTVPPGKSCRWYFLNSILLFSFYIFLCVGFLYILEFITLLFEDLTQ